MNKLKTMPEIRSAAFEIEERLRSTDVHVAQTAMEDYAELVDRFYSENEEMMVPQQYEAAKKDVEYFLTLVYLALHYGQENASGK